MNITTRDWLIEEERDIWDACGTPGIEVNVKVGVAKDLRKHVCLEGDDPEAHQKAQTASAALEMVKSVVGRGPIRSLLTRVSRNRSHWVDRAVKYNTLFEMLTKVEPHLDDKELSQEVFDLLKQVSSEWMGGSTTEEGIALLEQVPDDAA